MAKRKKKDPFKEVLGGLLGVIFLWVFLVADSISVAILVVVAFFIAIQLVLIAINTRKQKKINESGILQVDKMTGIQFEEFLMLRYRSMGYNVKETPVTGDFGADLVLHKDSIKIVIQAKRYSKPVGIKAVQEVNSARSHYKTDEAWVVTNNYFTSAAKKLADSNKVKLINRDQLINILSETVLFIK